MGRIFHRISAKLRRRETGVGNGLRVAAAACGPYDFIRCVSSPVSRSYLPRFTCHLRCRANVAYLCTGHSSQSQNRRRADRRLALMFWMARSAASPSVAKPPHSRSCRAGVEGNRQRHHVSHAVWSSARPFTPAVQVGDIRYLAGQIGTGASPGRRSVRGIQAETRQTMMTSRTCSRSRIFDGARLQVHRSWGTGRSGTP